MPYEIEPDQGNFSISPGKSYFATTRYLILPGVIEKLQIRLCRSGYSEINKYQKKTWMQAVVSPKPESFLSSNLFGSTLSGLGR